MFLPIGDEPNLRGTPYVTYVLVGINVAVFLLISLPLTTQGVDPADPAVWSYLRQVLQVDPQMVDPGQLQRVLAQMSAYDLFIFEHGFKPAAPSLADLISSMFLHGGWLHLAGNMLFLWIYGDNVELHAGRLIYVVLYFFTGLTAVALHAVFRLDSLMPMVGASGAISGVLGCYFLWFPHNQVRLLVVFFFITIIRLPARLVLGFYLIVENLLPFLVSQSGTGVAYGAHIGGFIGGLGAAAAYTFWRQRGGFRGGVRGLGARGVGARFSHMMQGDEEAPEPGFSRAIAESRWSDALRLYSDMGGRERHRLPDDDVLALADWLTETGQLAAALAVLQRFVATHPASDTLPRAFLRAGLIHLREHRLPAARQNFLAVLDLDASPEEVEGARAALAEVERRERTAGPSFH